MEKNSQNISLIIPVYNEEESIPILYNELKEVLEKLGKDFEIIFVDDGSSDNSFEVAKKIHQQDWRVKIIRFRKNFGQSQALSAGFNYAQYGLVVTLDGDLQNDPKDIPILLEKINEGYDIVNGWRKDRKDPYLSRCLPSQIANWLISITTGVKLHDYGCTLKIYRSEIVKNTHLYGELHRFLPALASFIGAKIIEVPVNHHPRKFGKSKYSLSRSLKVILDLITVHFMLFYSTKPMQIFGFIGFIFGFIGFLIAIYLTSLWFMGQGLSDRPLLLLSIVLMVVGVQFVSIGLLGEFMTRIYHEAQHKPTYAIKEIIDKPR